MMMNWSKMMKKHRIIDLFSGAGGTIENGQ